uniref:Uncharacterized protein n=1 Tax=Anguilla anguilla TaxID=7936 RepID=A0A0E9W993_ANGAN
MNQSAILVILVASSVVDRCDQTLPSCLNCAVCQM